MAVIVIAVCGTGLEARDMTIEGAAGSDTGTTATRRSSRAPSVRSSCHSSELADA